MKWIDKKEKCFISCLVVWEFKKMILVVIYKKLFLSDF